MNYAVVLAPNFALQAVRRADAALVGKPVALVEGEGRKARITGVSEEARDVTPGLAVTLAMARCRELVIRPRDPAAEADTSRILLAAAFTLAPRVEATAPGNCTADLRGANATQTETQMRACVAELARAGLAVRLGAGATPFLATYAAHQAEPVLIVHDPREFLAPLPIDAAEPTAAQAAVLHGWGIRTFGQLTTLPKTEIGERLGTDGVRLWERAAGEATRVLRLVEPVRTFAAEWTYEPPVEAMEPLLFRLRRFAECVALELRGAGLVADKLTLSLLLEDETDYVRAFRLPEPGANVDGWLRILHSHLETVRTAARVTGVRLVATPARPPEKQDGLFDVGLRDPVLFWENLARLAALVGDDRVGTPALCDTWQPDAVVLEKPLESVPAPADDPVNPPRGLTLRRFRPPWPAEVRLAGDHPVAVDAAEFHAEVRVARGPFRLSGTWWKPPRTWAVETWQIESDSGAIYEITRTKDGWAVVGVLD